MEDKYYTPELSELHVDFSYEELRMGEWIKINDFSNAYDYEDSCLYGFIKALESGNIRVKYLDAEDFTECEFSQTTHTPEEQLVFTKEVANRGRKSKATIIYNTVSHHLLIWLGAILSGHTNYTLYAGQCKNKSKLKILLKDLGI